MQLASTVNHYEQFRSLLQSHIAKLKSLQFSERFFHLCSNAAALVPAAETLQFYEEIKQRMSVSISPTEPNDHIFIDGGISHINKIIASKKPYTYLTPYSVFFLRKNAANLSVQMPEWLPEVYKTDSLDGNHSYTYLFNWSTVRVEHLCSRYIGMLVDAAYNEALGRPSDKKAELVVAVNNFADLGKLNVQPTA